MTNSKTNEKKRRSSAQAKNSLKPFEEGPNGYPVGYTKTGDKVELIPDEDEREGFWPMILLRGDKAIHEAYAEFREKVWWNRRQAWLQSIENGELALTEGQQTILELIKKNALKVERKYGKKNLLLDEFQLGVLNGRMSALAWVTGSEWDESLDI